MQTAKNVFLWPGRDWLRKGFEAWSRRPPRARHRGRHCSLSGNAPDRPIETIGSDWALVSLDTKLPSADRVLPIISDTPEVGSTVMLGGYQQDHPLVLMADTECRIVGHLVDASGRLLLRHNCAGTRGVSGVPLLIEKGGKGLSGNYRISF